MACTSRAECKYGTREGKSLEKVEYGPSEFIAELPARLGYVPNESLVVVPISATRRPERISAVVADDDLQRFFVGLHLVEGDAVMLVAVSAEPFELLERATRYIECRLDAEFALQAFDPGQLWIEIRHYAAGQIPDYKATMLAAAMTFDGWQIYRSAEAMREVYAPVGRPLGVAKLNGEVPRIVRAVNGCMKALKEGGPVKVTQIGALLRSFENVKRMDRLGTDNPGIAFEVFTQCARRLAGVPRARAIFLAGAAAARGGQFGLVEAAIDTLWSEDDHDALFVLLEEVRSEGVDALEQLLER